MRYALPMVPTLPEPIRDVLDLIKKSLAVLNQLRDEAMEIVLRAIECVRGEETCIEVAALLEELRQFLKALFNELHEEESLRPKHTSDFCRHAERIRTHFLPNVA